MVWKRPNHNTHFWISRELETRGGEKNTVTFVAEFNFDIDLWYRYMLTIENEVIESDDAGDLSKDFIRLSKIHKQHHTEDYNVFVLYVAIGPYYHFQTVKEMIDNIEMSVVLVTNPRGILTKHEGIIRNRNIRPDTRWHKNLSMYLHAFGGVVACDMLGMDQGIMVAYPYSVMHKIIHNTLKNISMPPNFQLEHYFSQSLERSRDQIINIQCVIEYFKNINTRDNMSGYKIDEVLKRVFSYKVRMIITEVFDALKNTDFLENEPIGSIIQMPQYITLKIDFSHVKTLIDLKNTLVQHIIQYIETLLNNDVLTHPIYPEVVTDTSIIDNRVSYYIKCFANSNNPVKLDTHNTMQILSDISSFETAIDISLLRYYFYDGATPLHVHSPIVHTELESYILTPKKTLINTIRDNIKSNDDQTVWLFSKSVDKTRYRKIYFKAELLEDHDFSPVFNNDREKSIYHNIKTEKNLDIYMVWCTSDKTLLSKSVSEIINSDLYLYRFFMVFKTNIPIVYHTLDHFKNNVMSDDFVLITHAFGSCIIELVYQGYIKFSFFGLSTYPMHIIKNFIENLGQDIGNRVIIGDRADRVYMSHDISFISRMIPHGSIVNVWLNYIPSENKVIIQNADYNYQFIAPKYIHRFTHLKDMDRMWIQDMQLVIESNFLQNLLF